jgi:hypothetical protein
MLTPPVVEMMVIEDELAALALRGALEYWGVRVNMHYIGAANPLVELLDGSTPLAETIILMCHGVEAGLYLPELAPAFAAAQRYTGVISAADFRDFLRLPDNVVINTGCSLGTPDYGAAFLAGGCRAYIGAAGDPEGNAALFYILHLFYAWHCQGKPLADAHAEAARHDHETAMFSLYKREP